MSFTRKRKRTEGTSEKKSIFPLIPEEQVLSRVEEETPLIKVERNDPPEHVVREKHVKGRKINFPN